MSDDFHKQDEFVTWQIFLKTVRRLEGYRSIKHVIKQTAKEYEGWNFNSGNYLFTTDTK